MIINTNMASLNTLRQLGNNEKATHASLAKLSSGLRINTAADDAAGLSISEKMRGQISGLNKASSNAQNAISLTSTAEGALNETTSILQRMRELAVQAGDGSTTTTDRNAMQQETNQLVSAINDIGNQTQFNTKNLLDGSQAGATGVSTGVNTTIGGVAGKLTAASVTASANMAGLTVGAFAADTVTVDGTAVNVNWQNLSTADQATVTAGFATGASAASQNDAAKLIVDTINSAIDQSGTSTAHVSGYVAGGKLNIVSGTTGTASGIKTAGTTSVLGKALGGAGTTGAAGTDKFAGSTVASGSVYNVKINGIQMAVTSTAAYTSGTTTMSAVATDMQTNINTAIGKYNTDAGLTAGQAGFVQNVTVNSNADGRLQVNSESGAVNFSDNPGNTFTADLGLDNTKTTTGAGALTFQVGANAGQSLSFSIADMRSSALGVAAIDLSTTGSASNAVNTIDKATALVSDQRSKLGAVQNRLEHTINNLGTSSQNITTAEANIRDVDMAKEMTDFQKNNILQQAAQSMLAQANQQGQGVLKLLQ